MDLDRYDRWPRFPWDKGSNAPILWDTARFDFIDGYTRLLHERVPGMSPEQWMNLVHLRDRESGLAFWVRNVEYIESHMHRKQIDKVREAAWLDGNANDRTFLREVMSDGDPVLSFGMYHRMQHAVVGTFVNDRKTIYAGARQSDYSILNSNTNGQWYIAGIVTLPWTEYHSQHTGRLLRLNLNRMVEANA